MKRNIYTILFLIGITTSIAFSQTADSTVTEEKITTEASYVFDMGRVLSGGLEQSNFYLGMIDIALTAKLWKNGEFYFQVENTHGATPSANLVGDLQVFSNIENAHKTYLYMAWYKHTFNKLTATFGVHDLNSEFVGSEYAGLFCNSSFGIQPSASWNMPVSIFPKNTLGLILAYDISDKLKFQTSVYDGDPSDLDVDPYNLNFKVDTKNEGLISFSELHYVQETEKSETPNTYKLGFHYHSAEYTSWRDGSTHKGNYGLYFIGDHAVSKNVGVFVQLGITPQDINTNSRYAGVGVHIQNFAKRPNDILGLAFAYAKVTPAVAQDVSINNERAIEVTYSYQATDAITIKPDMQYIISPGVSSTKNALVGFVRCSVDL